MYLVTFEWGTLNLSPDTPKSRGLSRLVDEGYIDSVPPVAPPIGDPAIALLVVPILDHLVPEILEGCLSSLARRVRQYCFVVVHHDDALVGQCGVKVSEGPVLGGVAVLAVIEVDIGLEGNLRWVNREAVRVHHVGDEVGSRRPVGGLVEVVPEDLTRGVC